MSFVLRIACTLLALTLPNFALAAPPPGVTGLTAEIRDGSVILAWDPVPDERIAYYRVYYSRESILENQGAYDDFEATPGPENIYVFETPPPAETLYFAVLAVNQDGEESEAFLEEVSVTFPPPEEMPAPEVAMEPEVQPEVAPEPVRLVAAEAFSATGVLLTFSQAVILGPGEAGAALKIVDASGAALAITRMIQQNERLILHTDIQERGKIYTVIASEPLQGERGAPLDPDARTATFQGHPQGRAPMPAEAPPPPPIPSMDMTQPRDVTNLRLRAQQQAGGLYTVTATWEYENKGELAHYIVRQSRDRGATAGPQQQLPIDIGGVQLQNVDPGPFGLAVYTVNIYGAMSSGVFQSIDLPGAPLARPTPRPTATVAPTQRETRVGRLADTGGGLALLPMVLTGMLLGWKRARRL